MTTESREHLSSLMDGELSRETGLFMARRLSSDADLCDAWKRYHLIRDCIRRPGSGAAMVDLSERLRERLDSEPAEAVTLRRNGRWLRPTAGLAIAASVALMAVVLVGPERTADPQAPGSGAEPEVAAFTSPNNIPAMALSQPASYSPGDVENARRLNSYLLRHNQLAGSTGRQGFVSFVPIMMRTQEATGPAAADQVQDAAANGDPETKHRP